jgi:hypothetical protein
MLAATTSNRRLRVRDSGPAVVGFVVCTGDLRMFEDGKGGTDTGGSCHPPMTISDGTSPSTCRSA